MTRHTVIVAPDKFKGSLTAAEAARRIAAGVRRAAPDADVRTLPVADGGDGTVDAAVAAGFTRVRARVSGPTGRPVDASYAARGDTAVIELAEACGSARLPGGVPAPLTADSTGVGELLRHALDGGRRRLVLGLGGSASTDGGSGMVRALGVRTPTRTGGEPVRGGAGLLDVDRVDAGALASRLAGAVVRVASDVDNPLLGPTGAAAVYAPQKGADPRDVALLEDALTHWARVVARDVPGGDVAHLPGAGAAGGAGFGALAFLGAEPRPGIELLLDLLGFGGLLDGATLVITGEGRLDRQTLHGKAPAGVAAAARARGIPVAAVCGRIDLPADRLAAAGITHAYALGDLARNDADSLARAGDLAEAAGERLARDLLTG